jgi:signal transduction histidine kinase
MYFRKAGQSQTVAASSRIKQLQYSLVFRSSPYSIIAAALAAVTQYFFLNVEVDSPLLDIWISGSLLVYFVGYLMLRLFARKRKKYPADYDIAGKFLLAFVIAIGLIWGSSGLFLLPLVDAQAQLIILILTMAVITEIASALSYRYKLALSFIALVMIPAMIGIYISDGLATLSPLLAVALLSFYLLLLIKLVMNTGSNVERMLKKEVKSGHRERELRDQSEQANQMSRDKSKFIANMSHEMRTPMHAILGFSDLGAKKSTSISREKLHDYFLRINESGQRLLNLLDALIDLSNLEAGRLDYQTKNNDMKSTIESAIAQMKPKLEERSISVDVISKLDVTMAHYDNDKLMQVLQNLLSNALKFSPIDSVISIVIEGASLPFLLSKEEQKSRPALSVSVVDQGVGIAENDLETIFDKLAQSSSKALRTGDSGLSLAICREIIQHHNGVITAHNNIAAGATFTFTIPL